MTSGRAVWAIARADFLERTRRYSFLVTLIAAVLLGYAAATGRVLMRLDDYRGVYTAGWIGTMVATVTTIFVSLVGFYVVKNAIDRDRSTRVGQILAATPLSRRSYMLGKLASNFAVLAVIVGVLAVGATVMFFVAGEDPRFDAWALLSPFLLVALPSMAIVAALALCFEAVPLLRAGFGNIVWFFGWCFAVALPELTKVPWLDPLGGWTTLSSLQPAARSAIPGYRGGMSLTISAFQETKVAETLRWPGVHWTAQGVALRLLWVAVAVLLALAAASVFDRFDGTRMLLRLNGSRRRAALTGAPLISSEALSVLSTDIVENPRLERIKHLTPLESTARSSAFGRLLSAELRLALQGSKWWWYAVAAGLLIAQFLAPLDVSRGPLLAVAWIWPTLIWSAMGAREKRFETRALLFSSSRILPRQVLACLASGFVVALVTGSGAGLRLVAARDLGGVSAWLAGAFFLPAVALFLGVVSGTSKWFEGVYVALWYIGPMNHTRGLDFTGAANGPQILHYAALYAAVAFAATLLALAARSRQIHSQ